MVRSQMRKHAFLIFLFVSFAILTKARQNLMYLIKTPKSFPGIEAVSFPNAGLDEVMPDEVLEVIEIVNANHLTEVEVSRDLFFSALGEYDFSLEQRLVEGLWPRHIVTESPNQIMFADVPAPRGCKPISLMQLVKYALCH